MALWPARDRLGIVGDALNLHWFEERKLCIGTDKDAWKVRHAAANPHVSITVPIAKRIPAMPWINIPAATITFAGVARVVPVSVAPPELLQAVFRVVDKDAAPVANSCIIEVTPEKEFVTYGVGVPLMQMRHPEPALGARRSSGRKHDSDWGR